MIVTLPGSAAAAAAAAQVGGTDLLGKSTTGNNGVLMKPTTNDDSIIQKNTATTATATATATTMTMMECLQSPDPIAALQKMACQSADMVRHYTHELQSFNRQYHSSTGSKNSRPPASNDSDGKDDECTGTVEEEEDEAIRTIVSCSGSLVQTLDTIYMGGQEASNTIRTLERQKRLLDHHAAVILTAVTIRKQSTQAAAAVTTQSYHAAAEALQPWLLWQQQQQQVGKNAKTTSTTTAANVVEEKNDTDDTDKNNDDTVDTDDDINVMNDPRLAMYIGDYTLQQLQSTYDTVRTTVLTLYETAVRTTLDLQTLGTLTPILSMLQLDFDALRLYKIYVLSILETSMTEAVGEAVVVDATTTTSSTTTTTAKKSSTVPKPPLYIAMGRVYNVAVTTLRHHLPMVSYCLYRASGDVSMIQLVHAQTEQVIIGIIQQHYRHSKTLQLSRVARTAIQIYTAIEDRYTGRVGVMIQNHTSNNRRPNHDDDDDDIGDADGTPTDDDDCGFRSQIGTLSDVDVTMEEVAMCIQHTESYLRFVQHTCMEINRARKLRHDQSMDRTKLERERQEWAKSGGNRQEEDTTRKGDEEEGAVYHDVEILSRSTPLHECIAEVGGQYAAIERCLLIASMQRAFDFTNDDDPKSYRPMSTLSSSSNTNPTTMVTTSSTTVVDAWQTTLVETCWYAARRGTQRAFATGHIGTASAVTNFVVECLTDVCLPVLSRRGDDYGIQPLKPGDGLLVGSVNLFNNASNLIRQGGGAVSSLQLPTSVVTAATGSGGGGGTGKSRTDELIRKQKREEGIIRACAMMNDIEVAVHHTKQLESILYKLIDKGFPPNTHETEQLRMCVKALNPVAESFQLASNTTMETLEAVLKPRFRSIVNDAVGVNDTTAASTFIGAVTTTTLGGVGTKSHFGGDHHHYGRGGGGGSSDMARMNYELDEEAYSLLQLSEGYVSRLGTLLDELLSSIRKHLAPRLWDVLLLQVIGTVCKRLEILLRKCEFTELGGLAFDADLRDLVSYTKDQLHSPDYSSNTNAVLKACPTLAKLLQMSKLLQAEFENASGGNELLRLPDDE